LRVPLAAAAAGVEEGAELRMLQLRGPEYLEPVLPGDPLPHLRGQVQIEDLAALDLLLALLLPAVRRLRLLEEGVQIRAGRARDRRSRRFGGLPCEVRQWWNITSPFFTSHGTISMVSPGGMRVGS